MKKWFLRFVPVKKIVGNRIRKIRESQDITQENVADELNITFGAYSKIERGITDPQVNRLYAIAKILKVNVVDFFQDKNDPAFAEDPFKKYGFATKTDVEELTLIIKQLKQEVEKLKGKMTDAKKQQSKKKKIIK
jgi:transcriptional regulator with XRE-family HTH domain